MRKEKRNLIELRREITSKIEREREREMVETTCYKFFYCERQNKKLNWRVIVLKEKSEMA